MYNRQNPLALVGAIRRANPGARRTGIGRARFWQVGAEFGTCPDGTQVKGNPTPEKCGYAPSGGGTGSGSGTSTTGTWGPTPPMSGGGTGSGGGWTPTRPEYDTPIQTPGGCAPVCPACPEDVKRITMPFKPDSGFTVAVLAGATARFIGNPQYLFKPDRLFIASTIGPFFDVVNFIIGNVPQSLSQGNIPAEMFSEVSTYTLMSFDQAYPGKDVILEVVNKSSVTQNFQASLVGEAIMRS